MLSLGLSMLFTGFELTFTSNPDTLCCSFARNNLYASQLSYKRKVTVT